MSNFFLIPTGGSLVPSTPSTNAQPNVRAKPTPSLPLAESARASLQKTFESYSDSKTRILVRRYGIK